MIGNPSARTRRLGGRSARVRAAVLQATMDELKEKGLSGLSIGDVARRSGVHPTSIYRRWKTVEQLTLDAALAAAAIHVQVPDTGSLKGDLAVFLRALDAHVRSPLGRTLLTVSGLIGPAVAAARDSFWRERFERAKIIFERAIARGEIPAGTDTVSALEFSIAPIYLRAMVLHLRPAPAAIARQIEMILTVLKTGGDKVGVKDLRAKRSRSKSSNLSS